MSSKVAIVSAYTTKFSERWGDSWIDLILECGLGAVSGAGLERKDISKIYCGNMGLESFAGQRQIVSKVYEELFDNQSFIPMTRVSGGETSGSKALDEACNYILSGLHKGEQRTVVVGGVEKVKDVKSGHANMILDSTVDREREAIIGKGLYSQYGEVASRYIKDYGAHADHMHLVAVKNHKNATENKKAHFRSSITLDHVNRSPVMSDPIRMLDCYALSDGASAVVLMPENMAKKQGKEYVTIESIRTATDTLSLYSRPNFTTFNSTIEAGNRAMKEAGVKPNQINVAEIHDSFTIAEMLAYEDLGFVKKGQGFEIIKQNMMSGSDPIEPANLETPVTFINNNQELVVNPSGGLKARGHAIGATGVAQAAEIYHQLLGKSEKRQADNAEIGLTHNMGGVGSSAVVGIFKTG